MLSTEKFRGVVGLRVFLRTRIQMMILLRCSKPAYEDSVKQDEIRRAELLYKAACIVSTFLLKTHSCQNANQA